MDWKSIKDVIPGNPREVVMWCYDADCGDVYFIGELGGKMNHIQIRAKNDEGTHKTVCMTHWCELTVPNDRHKD